MTEAVEFSAVESFEAFAASQRVNAEAFEFPQELRDQAEAELDARYAEHTTAGNPVRIFNALIEGEVVGTAVAVLGPAGVNMFGGSVLPSARGRGVYRALTQARWDLAAANDTPALTIQAGRMSRPIVERLGFQLVGTITVYVDEF